ncbi:MAG TPA: metalloregulator ArsR/SmtB family transcription factor [Ktedonobacterales bacterium]|nr:metalloregulator ArsR/SmtB family transcription factor [Ktedonobacterales bacterium]
MTTVSASSSTLLMAKLFRGLSDPARLSCLLAVRKQERTVGEIVAATSLSQPNVSKHLACLRDCGLVHAERAGRHVTYCLCGTGVEEVLLAADTLLARSGAAIAACPEDAEGGGETCSPHSC